MPPPLVEPEAWERQWKDHSRSWKQLLRVFVQKVSGGAEEGSFSAHPAMGVLVCSNSDMEFLCPNCPGDASKAWLEKPVAAVCPPVCPTQFHSRARAVDHLAHRAERCRQAIQEGPDR